MTTAVLPELEPIVRLTRDLKTASKTLSSQEARYLTDSYYAVQDYRKAAANQQRALDASGEPHSVIAWLFGQMETLEKQIKRALDAWSDQQEPGRWMKSIVGIGPVLAAGLLAHIDIEKAPTAGHIWRFAGLDPTVTWEKKTKRPWNARLKVLCWKVGESFIKFQNHPQDFYGRHYVARKRMEHRRNLSGELAEFATAQLLTKKFGEDTEAKAFYSGKLALPADMDIETLVNLAMEDVVAFKKALRPADNGVPMLPPAHIHARATRWTTKLFLSHAHAVMYECHYGQPAAHPYVMAILGHADMIPVPNWPMSQALR